VFALAHHLLAETMYWELSSDEERLLELGAKIEYHSRNADRTGTADRLRPGERRAVNAFRAFWTGDYDLARARYDSLLAFEPYDLESLVLRGAVEFEDPMLSVGEDGHLRPRQNLNVARAVFDTATVLSAQWELSWGHLHVIDRKVAETAFLGWCYGFEAPGDELVPPYEIRDAVEQEYFCPIVDGDTISWELSDDILPPGTRSSVEAAATLHDRTLELLDHWAAVERDQPRHHEELSKYLLWELQIESCDSDTVRSDSLLAAARSHFERALEMRGDTTPQNRLTLASLFLGSGDLKAALAESDRALAEMGDWESMDHAPPAPAAANTYLAAGRAHPAVEILERVWGENTMGFRDPQEPTRSIDAADTYGTLNAIKALGSLGLNGPEVARRFDILRRAWRDAPLSERDRAALRMASLIYVEPALVHSPERWDSWFDGWEAYGLEPPAIWKGFLAAAEDPADTAEARIRLEQAVADLNRKPFGLPIRPSDLFLPILLAERIGADSVAVDLRERLAGCALRLDNFDTGWAVRSALGLGI
jgi:tetratricopeptide (TPR) repeat protein